MKNLNIRLTQAQQFVLLILIAAILIIWKAPDALTNPQFWAEDGAVFFRQQFESISIPFFVPYAGYLHAIPRLVAWAATWVSYAYVPLFYNTAAILLGALGIAYFAQRMAFLLPPWITLLAIVLPPSNGEEFGTLTNVQWFLQFALFAMVFGPQTHTSHRSKGSFLWRSIAILLLGLTGPFSISCAVLGACAWLMQTYWPGGESHSSSDRKRKGLPPIVGSYELALVSLTAFVQFILVAFISPRPDLGKLLPDAIWLIFTAGLQQHWLGDSLLPRSIFAFFLLSILGYVAISAIRKRQIEWRILACMLAFGGAQLIAICNAYTMRSVNLASMNADRYFFFFRAACWISIAVLLSKWKPSEHVRSILLVPVLLAIIAVSFPEHARRPPLADFQWKSWAADIETGTYPLEIPLNPYPWKMVLHTTGEAARKRSPNP